MSALADAAVQPAQEGLQPGLVGDVQTTSHVPSNEPFIANQSVRSSGLNAELANRWLLWQCKMIADVITGCVYSTDGTLLASRPQQGEGQAKLHSSAMEALQLDRAFISTEVPFGKSDGRLGDIIATPVKNGDKTLAVVALLMAPRPQSRQNVVLQLLQWGGYWLESLSQLSDGIQQEAGSFTQTLLGKVVRHSRSSKAYMEIASTMADRLGCDRVSIGLRHGVVVRMECISHLASFDSRTQLVRRLEAAMEETLDQNAVITVPAIAGQSNTINKAHRELTAKHDGSTILSCPLRGQSTNFGAVVFERNERAPFDADTAKWCESVLTALAPVAELKMFEERPLTSKVYDSGRRFLADLFGQKYLKLKMIAGSCGALVLLSAIFNGTYEVSAPAHVEGAVSQVVAAPVAGFVKTSTIRAGDLVSEGEVLATLDDRALQLELKKWQGEENKINKAYQEALAKKARTELSILRAKADQIDAELALVNQRIERTELVAPTDGYVVSGDLSQSLGAPVEIGDVLFEIAPLTEYRVVIEVDERDMASVDTDKTGEVLIAALPGNPIKFDVDHVVPVAVSGEGNSFFRVEASIGDTSPELRPGMEGVARVEIGQRKLFWIWTHKLVDRISLWFWSIGW